MIKGLKPYEFFKWFNEICKIPHGSKNEKALADFLVDFAKKRSLKCSVDQKGNVFMKVPPSKGYENEKPILFQAHIDMVCVKDDGCNFDFNKDAIRLKITGNKLHADGTSLGADNGVGVATMLAIADSEEVLHPPLEFLFTVEEEIGMLGIRAFDISKITARRMINMDCGDSHVIAVSSMGKRNCFITKKFSTFEVEKNCCALTIKLGGGKGGHSGLMIREGRACAGNNLGKLLTALSSMPVRLCSLQTHGVAILKGLTAVIVFPSELLEEVKKKLNDCFNDIKSAYSVADPDLTLSLSETNLPKLALEKQDTVRVAKLLSLIKTAPYKVDENDSSILITLGVLLKAVLSDKDLAFEFHIRSTNDADCDKVFNGFLRQANELGFEVQIGDSYSGWKEVSNSLFRKKFIDTHKEVFGYAPELERVSGGIETGIITAQIPDMDAVGIAPTARGAHTTEEHILLDETEDYWKWLITVLAKKD